MQSKNPEEIVSEFIERTYVLDFDHSCCFNKERETTWLRSSLASVLCYMTKQMSEKCQTGEHQMSEFEEGWDACVDDCKAILINEAKKITGL